MRKLLTAVHKLTNPNRNASTVSQITSGFNQTVLDLKSLIGRNAAQHTENVEEVQKLNAENEGLAAEIANATSIAKKIGDLIS